jgi:predicted methyltransferase
MMVVISHYQARQVMAAHQQGAETISLSLDLEMSKALVPLRIEGILLPDGKILGWDAIREIEASKSSCFTVEGGSTRAIQFYSEQTDRLYSLYPTMGAPTMLVSGIPMHRIKGTDPHQDTLEKIRAIKPVVGQVLDTATGLGYTAIQAARTAEHVVTIELEPAALQVCRLNPWSLGLFGNPKISQIIGDSYDVVAGMPPASFTRVIHDPPAFSLAGELYSADFFYELYRVMRNRARLFHYIGDPESKSGRSVTAGVIRRLEEVGFSQVRRVPRAFGVVAEK